MVERGSPGKGRGNLGGKGAGGKNVARDGSNLRFASLKRRDNHRARFGAKEE
jgi:hypothetical protein